MKQLATQPPPKRAASAAVLPYVAAGVLTGVAGYFVGRPPAPAHQATRPPARVESEVQVRRPASGLVAPLVDCRGADDDRAASFSRLRAEVTRVVEAEKRAGHAARIGVYVREADTGLAFGLGQELEFTPGQLVHLATAVAVDRVDAEQPQALPAELAAPSGPGSPTPGARLVGGERYGVSQLVDLAVGEADQSAGELLRAALPANVLQQVAAELDLSSAENPSNPTVSARQMANALRSVYNGGVMRRASAERVLALLAGNAERTGLRAGVPAHVPVAHLRGSSARQPHAGEGAQDEFHECGIVYQPKRPFVLCVMTAGPSRGELERVVTTLADAAYVALRPPN